ncbi:hypothetical protein TRVL_07420 [Trypanosoma vivax]|nr:hypothetical protein TRVL_07420 [Trypanosoma vivax]
MCTSQANSASERRIAKHGNTHHTGQAVVLRKICERESHPTGAQGNVSQCSEAAVSVWLRGGGTWRVAKKVNENSSAAVQSERGSVNRGWELGGRRVRVYSQRTASD